MSLPEGKGKMSKAEVKGARDGLQERILTDTKWCCYCCYGGCGLDGMDLPCFFVLGEVCCLGGMCKVAPCWDQDGCCAFSTKCCCTLAGFEFPIDNTPGIGCCCARVCSNVESKSLDDCKSDASKSELDTLKKTIFCTSCYCCYEGCTYDLIPVCEQQGKCCCCWTQFGTAGCCDDGCIEYDSKCCCIVTDCSLPAGNTPGCVCCGVPLCCASMPKKEETAEGGAAA